MSGVQERRDLTRSFSRLKPLGTDIFVVPTVRHDVHVSRTALSHLTPLASHPHPFLWPFIDSMPRTPSLCTSSALSSHPMGRTPPCSA